ncbi:MULTISPECIES: bifunctional biotin--[acetyl-CoA-carboxylase] ligase/biotin operon repressor BirA [unclassified Pseudomonas]|jgi:BirA family biotin operon repressor/biotin-[acetyl-CoA-carboxylase] ligase|uniref:bifunctional biotin--[acetyl-CoA-carboxylase] ligase/biotin operon repressor BirA n=1 Tax=unclassified Pseudomonas TaxID=196821 RepID=UPI0019E6D619|nr:bifunctional biotin--[acetyl-CoA-carboxylase] ligase/biotin operon repressor BirA [Pseudomonas sp.]MBF0676217.1 bifunctional biotin--[acetyl-CoA-carboxylase] ligase/biotin operon repressor BirA [Pseudomonas sp.]
MLELLRLIQDGSFHSGETLGKQLGISRAAVWKQIEQLELQHHVAIHRVRGRGYRLAEPLLLLDCERIDGSALQLESVIVKDVLDSTNAESLRLVASGLAAPFIVLAEQQLAGRGRRGREWVSPCAENIYYSLVLRLDQGARMLEGLSLVVGLAALRVLREAGVERAGLKWPNDILVGNQKIAGILLELIGDPTDICHVVIGIGINVNMRAESNAIDRPWTSVLLSTGSRQDRNHLVSRLNCFLADYLSKQNGLGFAALLDEWEREHLWQGRQVVLSAGGEPVHGQVLGIHADGALRLLVKGCEQRYSGGELSLRLHDDS